MDRNRCHRSGEGIIQTRFKQTTVIGWTKYWDNKAS